MKVLNNVLGFATGQIASIAIETGVALGLDPASLVAVLESGSAASFALHSLLHNMIPDPVFTAHAHYDRQGHRAFPTGVPSRRAVAHSVGATGS